MIQILQCVTISHILNNIVVNNHSGILVVRVLFSETTYIVCIHTARMMSTNPSLFAPDSSLSHFDNFIMLSSSEGLSIRMYISHSNLTIPKTER